MKELLNSLEQMHLVHLLSAALCGSIIGFERERRDKVTGFRTHILVSLGACCFSLLSTTMGGEPDDKIAASVVSGIGFLGGGAIMRDKERITGLTTAATIWLTAAAGMACGFGRYGLAFTVTLLAELCLVIFRRISGLVRNTQAVAMKEKMRRIKKRISV